MSLPGLWCAAHWLLGTLQCNIVIVNVPPALSCYDKPRCPQSNHLSMKSEKIKWNKIYGEEWGGFIREPSFLPLCLCSFPLLVFALSSPLSPLHRSQVSLKMSITTNRTLTSQISPTRSHRPHLCARYMCVCVCVWIRRWKWCWSVEWNAKGHLKCNGMRK